MPRYTPPLSVLISVDDFPASLGFVENGLNTVFSSLYFKNFYSNRSSLNEEVQYGITILSKTRLDFNIGGNDGFSLVLNPSFVDGDTSEFPIFTSYHWPVKKFLEDFDLSSFDFSIASIYRLLIDIANVSETVFFKNLIYVFHVDYGSTGDDNSYQRFIADFNTKNNPATPLVYNNLNGELVIAEDILKQLSSNGNDYQIIDVVLNDYLTTDDDFGTVKEKTERLFFPFFGFLDLNTFQSFLVPKISASIGNLVLALEFPRTWLKPVDPNTLDVIEGDIKSALTYNVGTLIFDSERGFDFLNPDTFSLTPSQIGNTGLILEVTNLKLDLKEDSNIPEADAYGYGPEFKGVYAQSASITLPKKWFDSSENNPTTTARLAGYDILVGTGGFSGRLALEAIDGTSDPMLVKTVGDNGFEVGFSAFDINFDRNKVISSNIAGRLKIPRLKDANGNIAEIDITGHLDSDGDFLLTASEKDGFAPIVKSSLF